jgi:hypothetical protein
MPVDAGFTMNSQDLIVIERILSKLSRPLPNTLLGIERAVRFGFLSNFGRQSAGGGSAWAALAIRTQRERRWAGYPPTYPILVRSGSYMRSWTELGGYRQMVYRSDGWDMQVASSDYRAVQHEFGVRSRNLPARPVGALADADMRPIAQAVERWVDFVLRTTL